MTHSGRVENVAGIVGQTGERFGVIAEAERGGSIERLAVGERVELGPDMLRLAAEDRGAGSADALELLQEPDFVVRLV